MKEKTIEVLAEFLERNSEDRIRAAFDALPESVRAQIEKVGVCLGGNGDEGLQDTLCEIILDVLWAPPGRPGRPMQVSALHAIKADLKQQAAAVLERAEAEGGLTDATRGEFEAVVSEIEATNEEIARAVGA